MSKQNKSVDKLGKLILDLTFARESKHVKLLEKICEGTVFRLRKVKQEMAIKKSGWFKKKPAISSIDNKEVDLQISFFTQLSKILFNLRVDLEKQEKDVLFLRHTRAIPYEEAPAEAIEICDALDLTLQPTQEELAIINIAHQTVYSIKDIEGLEILEPKITPNPEKDGDINWVGFMPI